MSKVDAGDVRTAVWVGLAGLALIGFALGVVPRLLPDEEDEALRDTQVLFNTIAQDLPLGVYNGLKPRLDGKSIF
jgi:hypothetical protein